MNKRNLGNSIADVSIEKTQGGIVKGIILAGGSGTRLHPLTIPMTKQLFPVYNKPMIYYPLNTLMQALVRDVLIITTPDDLYLFQKLLKDGSQWGININYEVQESPDGLAQAFIIGEQFINGDKCCLILGDNLFHGSQLPKILPRAANIDKGATVFAQVVKDPERYGVVEFDSNNNVLSIVEKPVEPKSHWAVTGMYFYDERVVDFSKQLTPSERGELEISELNALYLQDKSLTVEKFGTGVAWLDTGTFNSMISAAEYVRVLEDRQGIQIGCVEETAWRNGWINSDQLLKLAEPLKKSGYGNYLVDLVHMVDENS